MSTSISVFAKTGSAGNTTVKQKMRSEQKRISISSKRQLTIPQKFYNELGFEKEAICMVQDGKLIIIPASHLSGGEFAEQILAELIEEGLSGNDLLEAFKIRQARIRPAVENMLTSAKAVARGETEYST